MGSINEAIAERLKQLKSELNEARAELYELQNGWHNGSKPGKRLVIQERIRSLSAQIRQDEQLLHSGGEL